MVNRRPNIWKLQASRNIEELIGALSYSDPDVRKRAAVALRVLGATDAVPALKHALEHERLSEVREHVAAALEHLDTTYQGGASKEKTRSELVAMLSDSNPDRIAYAAQKLGELGDQLATEALVLVFRNPLHPDHVRLSAARALLALKSAPSVVTLLAGLDKDNWRIRHNSVAVLGQLKATWATEPLIKTLDDPHPNVRLAAAAALHRFRTPQAIKALDAYKLRRTGQTKPLPMHPLVSGDASEKTSPRQVGNADEKSSTMVLRPTGLDEALAKRDEEKKQDSSPTTDTRPKRPNPE